MKKRRFLFAVGLTIIILLAIPGWILGENAIFNYHDQLDGEMVTYILQAKHLVGAGREISEFMGGADKTALTMPAPGCVLLFRLGSPLLALFLMQIAGMVIGYVGMFLLVLEVTDSDLAALAAGGLYAFLPFLPVYGLAQFGLPLLAWLLLQTFKGRWKKGAVIYGIFYALNSSLVLVGFAVLAVLAVWSLLPAARQSRQRLWAIWLGMAASYFLTNLSLIGQMLGLGSGITSHKAEYALAGEEFFAGWLRAFVHGGQHSVDYHGWFLAPAAVLLGIGLWSNAGAKRRYEFDDREGETADGGDNEKGKFVQRVMGLCLGVNLCMAGVAAAWNSDVIVAIRSHMGALGAFQLDRFLWLCPCLWYLLAGCCVAQGIAFCRQERKLWKLTGGLCILLTCAALGAAGLQSLKESDLKSNVQKLRNADYAALSFRDYYAIGVLEQVRDYLREQTGREPEGYRVVSLGIDPAAAYYHGFYCLDGYSNNYSLDYKHSFRRVIAPALAQSEYLRDYYDNWGNRCYLFGSECPGYYTIEKNGFYFRHLELDTEALRALGGDYLLSAAYIANSEELGLELMREEPFETRDSYYRIFVYYIW